MRAAVCLKTSSTRINAAASRTATTAASLSHNRACLNATRSVPTQSRVRSQITSRAFHTSRFVQAYEPLTDVVNDVGQPVLERNTDTGEFKFNIRPPPTAEGFHSKKIDDLSQQILELDMFEMLYLCKAVAAKLGIPFEEIMRFSHGPAPTAAPAAAAPVAEAAKEEKKEEAKPAEKTTFDVKLVKFDDGAKFKVLKEIRALKPGMSIQESKDYVENLPKVLITGLPKADAEKWAEKIKAVGGEVALD